MVVQTSWWPESTHGGIYQLLGSKATVDTGRKVIRGPLVSRGVETGVDLEIRPGGPARGQESVAALMKSDPSIRWVSKPPRTRCSAGPRASRPSA